MIIAYFVLPKCKKQQNVLLGKLYPVSCRDCDNCTGIIGYMKCLLLVILFLFLLPSLSSVVAAVIKPIIDAVYSLFVICHIMIVTDATVRYGLCLLMTCIAAKHLVNYSTTQAEHCMRGIVDYATDKAEKCLKRFERNRGSAAQ